MASIDSANKAEVLVYTISGCPYCFAARFRLRRRGIKFEEIRLERDSGFREFLAEKAGRQTAPQILIDGEPIGGSDDLAALDRSGALLPRIRREPFPVTLTRRSLPLIRRHGETRVIDKDGQILSTKRVD